MEDGRWWMALEDIFPGEAKVHLLQLLQQLSIWPSTTGSSSASQKSQILASKSKCVPRASLSGLVGLGPDFAFRISTPDSFWVSLSGSKF